MELKCLEFLYKEEPVYDEEGTPVDIKQVPIKLGFITKMQVELEDILAFKEHYNEKGILGGVLLKVKVFKGGKFHSLGQL